MMPGSTAVRPAALGLESPGGDALKALITRSPDQRDAAGRLEPAIALASDEQDRGIVLGFA